MFETSGDILNLVLAISIGFVGFFLSFLLFYLVLAVRDVNYVTRKARKIAEAFDAYIKTPTQAVLAFTEKLKTITQLLEKYNKKRKGKRDDDDELV
jgi:hypothetical protein